MVAEWRVVLSLDAELVWGFHDHEQMPRERISHARESWRYILGLFKEFDVPATWAVVGHLFLDCCDGVHADHPGGEEWFLRDPGGERTEGSEWFGRDLVDAISDSTVGHEIGSHSFSHVEFGKRGVSKEVAEAELLQSVDAAEEYGIDLTSFVFPRNNIGYRELLAEYGFSCYRGRAPDRWYDETAFRLIGKPVTFAFGKSGPPIVRPETDEHGLVNLPASMYLFSINGPARDAMERLTTDPIVRQVKLGLQRLTDEPEGTLHLWLHPNNVTTERDRVRLRRIVSMIAECRERYGIEVEPMSDVVEKFRENE